MTVIDAIDSPVEPYPLGRPVLVHDAALQGAAPAALVEARAEIVRLRRALEDAEQRADHDGLTGLLNRRGFERALATTVATCRRYRTEAALVYMDLDGFKAINDRFGHPAGDDALKLVANALLAVVRESDIVARVGGDEFAVILNRADRIAAEDKAEALARVIEATPTGQGGPIGLSYGIRAFEPGMTAAQMLAEADAAMFVRKGERRRA